MNFKIHVITIFYNVWFPITETKQDVTHLQCFLPLYQIHCSSRWVPNLVPCDMVMQKRKLAQANYVKESLYEHLRTKGTIMCQWGSSHRQLQ